MKKIIFIIIIGLALAYAQNLPAVKRVTNNIAYELRLLANDLQNFRNNMENFKNYVEQLKEMEKS